MWYRYRMEYWRKSTKGRVHREECISTGLAGGGSSLRNGLWPRGARLPRSHRHHPASFRQHRTSQFGNSAICFRPPPPSPLFIDYAHSSNGHFWIQGNLNTRNSIVFANSRAHVTSILIAISNLSNSDTKHITSHIVSEDGMCENARVPWCKAHSVPTSSQWRFVRPSHIHDAELVSLLFPKLHPTLQYESGQVRHRHRRRGLIIK